MNRQLFCVNFQRVIRMRRLLVHGPVVWILLGALFLSGCTSLPKASPEPVAYQTAPGAQSVLMSTKEKLTLFGQWWRPALDEPRAVVLLLHGTIAHSGFYAPWAEHLTENGYAVFGLDMRGWGQSQGFGRRGYVGDVDEYIDDVALAYAEVKRVYPELPVFLQGESLGGGVAILADLRGDIPVDGLILNAPGIKAHLGRFMPGWLADAGLWTIGNTGEVWPNFPVVPMGSKFLFEQVGKTFAFDPALRERAWNDPHMTHSALPVSWMTAVKDMGQRARKGMPQIDTPFIVLQGSKDNLVSEAASEMLMEKTGSTDKTRKFYEGMSHCTLHDFGKEQVWADIVIWLNERVPAGAPVRADTVLSAAPLPVDHLPADQPVLLGH